MSAAQDFHSPLSHFEPTELFDSLSTGIVVLDAQLCPIYANVSAQDFMAVSLRQARGRPFADLFYDPRQLVEVLRRSMTNLETCTQHELVLKALGSVANREASIMLMEVFKLAGHPSTGPNTLSDQSLSRMRCPISPPPTRKSAAASSRFFCCRSMLLRYRPLKAYMGGRVARHVPSRRRGIGTVKTCRPGAGGNFS